jgi:hypothetical protein
MQISKSDYMIYLKHPTWLWIKKRDPSRLPPIDPNTQAFFDTGTLFETYAERRFPNGVRLGFDSYNEYITLSRRTQQALEQGAKTLFQARFESRHITCISDVVDVVDVQTVDLYEIKSSTSVKPEHEFDLAFQMIVLERAGYNVRNIFVIHLNKEYIRQGEIDSLALTQISDITEAVKSKRTETEKNIQNALAILQLPDMPNPSPSLAKHGGYKYWLEIYKGFSDLPPYSIYDLAAPGIGRIAKLEALGIQTISDIPESVKLTRKQAQQMLTTRMNQQIIDVPQIKNFLNGLVYPLYFLDYETLGGLIPPFDGMSPYQQLPFQYSLYVLDSHGAELRHLEYLHREKSNPAPLIAESLRAHIGDTGTVLAWYADFEMECNRTLANLVSEQADFLTDINNRMQDLMLPFSSGWFVDKDFYGSASIKKVLPVLVPELSYKTLGIQEGQGAQRLWMQAVLHDDETIDKEKLFYDLTEYCGLDTFAMIKIYEKLKTVTI